ncbi:MAG: hypothetical protein WBC82_12405 [Dehalococcoidia bacterium]
MPFETGPYLKAAVFCEKVLREPDGVMSLIRVVDRVTITATGPDAPATMPKTPYNITAVIALTSGQSRGRHEIKIEQEEPSGLKKPPFLATVQMEGEDRSANVIVNMHLTFEMEGLFWFYVYIDDTLLTKMPFRIMYARMSTGTPRPPSTP